ncbi:MAG: SMP-30/gluconolactonase/LRE family protein [Acidobacteria bacterium]|nr:SMP-30/gluconolactonase/LRE family protein [Acidobacteriota bacterium]
MCLAVTALSGVPGVLGGTTHSEGDTQPVNDRPNPYRTVQNYFKLAEGRWWGSTSAVDIDIDGESIWVAERCAANDCAGSRLNPVLKFDPSGNLVRRFGERMFIFPHGIHVDREGNVWVTDAQGPDGKDPNRNGKGHAVYRFSPEGKVLLTLGTPGVAGDGTGELLNEPCDVVTAPNGDIFVADGHSGQNRDAPPTTVARIVKFTKDGTFIKSWGNLGARRGEFRTPHGLALDSRGRLFVADRGNNRIQIFDSEGRFLDEWKQFSRLSGIFIDKSDILYGADSESGDSSNPGWKRGIRIGSARDGTVRYFIPDPEPTPTGTSGAEGVAADAQGNVYGAEVGPQALKKYVRP